MARRQESPPPRARLQYVGQMPGRGTGSPVVFWRHLRRWAAETGPVSVLAGHGEDAAGVETEGWTVQRLRHRRPWWPPYRPGIWPLNAIRRYLWCRELATGPTPDVFLIYVGLHDQLLPTLGAAWAKASGRRWVAVVHDDIRAFVGGAAGEKAARWRDRLLAGADGRAYASPELCQAIEGGHSWTGTTIVLPPLGEGWAGPLATWQDAWTDRPHWVYAGKVVPAQWPELTRWAESLHAVGGVLEVVTASPAPAGFTGIIRAPFAQNAEALQYVARATAFLSAYPDTAAMPWAATSFPSKVIEFAALGVPAVIVADSATAVAAAAHRREFPGWLAPGDATGRKQAITALRHRSSWEAWAAATRSWWQRDWEPATVHTQLLTLLLPDGTTTR